MINLSPSDDTGGPRSVDAARARQHDAVVADVSTDHTASIPELRFLTANDQEDAVIAARAKVLDATSPAPMSDPAPDASAGDDEQREAA